MERESKRKSYRLVETRSVFGHCEVVRRMWLGGSLRLQSGAHAAKPCVYGEQGNPRFSAGSRAKRAHENRPHNLFSCLANRIRMRFEIGHKKSFIEPRI